MSDRRLTMPALRVQVFLRFPYAGAPETASVGVRQAPSRLLPCHRAKRARSLNSTRRQTAGRAPLDRTIKGARWLRRSFHTFCCTDRNARRRTEIRTRSAARAMSRYGRRAESTARVVRHRAPDNTRTQIPLKPTGTRLATAERSMSTKIPARVRCASQAFLRFLARRPRV